MFSDRRREWLKRLKPPTANTRTLVAESAGRVVGFAHVILDDHPVWGALLDNLHIAHDHQRLGIGGELMARIAQSVVEARPKSGIYLWVLEQNRPAQAFYESRGGQRGDREFAEPPGGEPSRLAGTPLKVRYAWSDA